MLQNKTGLGQQKGGKRSGELMNGFYLICISSGLNYLLSTVFNYPTLAECYRVAALEVNNKMIL